MMTDDAYATWKGWGDPSAYGAQEKRIWDALHARIGVSTGDRLLEVGFGQGAHLHYARAKGINASGIEQNERGHRIAREAGLRVFLGGLDVFPPGEPPFDAAILLDVIEHVPLNELIPLLGKLKALLKPGGKVLVTFPNGASPFGGVHQNGDLTHRIAFNRSSLEQLCRIAGYRITRYGDYPDPPKLATPVQWLKAPARWLIRAVVTLAVRAYHREPIGLSIAAVLEPV